MAYCSEKRNYWPDLLICAVLILTTSALYVGVTANDFINYDDQTYVFDNKNVSEGLSWQGIHWALITTHSNNWHPLTWLSHMLDCSLFGVRPGWHHLINVLLHMINMLLLFLAFRQMTGDPWRSGFVAALFALHPLHVESVAWVSERKDVLSALFWMLTMISYAGWIRHKNNCLYLTALLLFILGLAAKPVLVTLPFVLLLLDIWPLKRLVPTEAGTWPLFRTVQLVLEKTPFFALSAASSVVTYGVQQITGAVQPGNLFPLGLRVANAIVVYTLYLKNLVFPFHLTVYYPHPGMRSFLELSMSVAVLTTLTYLAVKNIRQYPHLLIGWLWYLGTLVPMIGLVQVGQQAMADRYTYIPLISIFVMISWSVPNRMFRRQWAQMALLGVSVVVFGIMTAISMKQLAYWKDSITLFEHALAETENNAMAHYVLGEEYARKGKTQLSISHFHAALRIAPWAPKTHLSIGNLYLGLDDYASAANHYRLALKIDPDNGKLCNNLGVALWMSKQYREAEINFLKSQKYLPQAYEAYGNMGGVLLDQGKAAEAAEQFSRAVAINPHVAHIYYKLGISLLQLGKSEKAISSFKKAIALQPGWAAAHEQIGQALAAAGRHGEARSHSALADKLKKRSSGKKLAPRDSSFHFESP